MRCLVIGGDGMLGHQLLTSWQSHFEVRVTLRRDLDCYRGFGLFHAGNAIGGVDAFDFPSVRRAVQAFRPQAVVNAVGIVKQRAASKEALPSLEINAAFPHRLRRLCEDIDARLIHVSTDCVFDGRRGGYVETDRCDAEDLYGLTKYLGEVHEAPAVTLRTSIIGLELGRKTGLIEWFLAQRGRISGFTRAIYTGLTTQELANVMRRVLVEHPQLTGLWQAAAAPISKYDLLSRLTTLLGRRDIEIMPQSEFFCDRSLSGAAFTERTGYVPPSWDEMLGELASQILARDARNVAA